MVSIPYRRVLRLRIGCIESESSGKMNKCRIGLRAELLLCSKKMSRSEIDRWIESDSPMLPQEVELARNVIRLRHGEAISGIAMAISLFAVFVSLSSVGAAALGLARTWPFYLYIFGLTVFFMCLVQWAAGTVTKEANRITRIEVQYFLRRPRARSKPKLLERGGK